MNPLQHLIDRRNSPASIKQPGVCSTKPGRVALFALTLLAVPFHAEAGGWCGSPICPGDVLYDIKSVPAALDNIETLLVMIADKLKDRVMTDGQTQMAGMKTALAHKAVAEGVASWQAKEDLRINGIETARKLDQPETTCQAAARAVTGPLADLNTKSNVRLLMAAETSGPRHPHQIEPAGTSPTFPPMVTTDNRAQYNVQTYDYLMSNFCSAAEAAANRCGRNPATSCSAADAAANRCGYPAAVQFAGGDMSADLLFGDRSGGETMMESQDFAVAAFISNIVDTTPPEVLRNPTWAQTPAGREYTLEMRQYQALMSLAKHSFHTISAAHASIF